MNYIVRETLKNIIREELDNLLFFEENGDLKEIKSMKSSIEEKLKNVYKGVTGQELNLPKIEIKIDDSIKDGKIAGFNHPKNGGSGLMGIKSKALKDKEYLKWVITHELIHASIGEDLPQSEEHEGLFKKIADGMGLPKKYQD